MFSKSQKLIDTSESKSKGNMKKIPEKKQLQ